MVLGGTAQDGDWNTEDDQADIDGIMERCLKVMPSLKASLLELYLREVYQTYMSTCLAIILVKPNLKVKVDIDLKIMSNSQLEIHRRKDIQSL